VVEVEVEVVVVVEVGVDVEVVVEVVVDVEVVVEVVVGVVVGVGVDVEVVVEVKNNALYQRNNKKGRIMSNISIGGKSFDISDEIKDKIDELLEEDECEEIDSLSDFVGKKMAFQCARYIYFGKIEKVNDTFIELSEAQTIFETGEFSAKTAQDAQDMPKSKMYLMRQSIESIYPTNWR